MTVAAGATLGGSGSISGPVSMAGSVSPGASGGFGTLSFSSLSLTGSSSTLLGIGGTGRGATYDAIDVSQSAGLSYGGDLSLSFSDVFGDGTSFGLFGFTGSPSGSYASVTASGSYGALTFSNSGGVWTAAATNGQTFTFTEATGSLVIVPEPASVVLAGIGASLAALIALRRRRC